MTDRERIGSWLDGPGAHLQGRDPQDYPGRRLGMPCRGPGSVARFGRRLMAILIDWTMCQLVAFGVFRVTFGQAGAGSWVPLGVFAAENLILVSTVGATFGQRILGIRLLSITGGRATLLQVLARTMLLCLAVPALVWDRDGRGLHDKGAGTVLVRQT